MVEPSAKDHATSSAAAQNLLQHIRDHRPEPPPAPRTPETDRSPPVESPQARSDDRSHVELSAKQRHCFHSAAMVKRFDDGVTYCRLCYACLTP